MNAEITFTNSSTGKKEKFVPLQGKRVTMYSCGPTVYNLIHIGNLRAALVADLIFRFLKYSGFDVVYARNYTDVDDRIIQQAIEEKTTSEAIAQKYIKEVEKDYAVAGLLEPTHKICATDHIPEMISMMETLIQKNHAYAVDGNIYYSISSFPSYGKLSRRSLEELEVGARVEPDTRKKSPMDFALWKASKPGEPAWDTPWGKGRPGWHLECSAMARKWLGDQIDIHHGGIDLIFPHHENEIAQSEACTGKEPFARYWLHHAFVTTSAQKMSKSLGNVFLARDFLTTYGTELTRFILLSAHYRSPLEVNEQSITQAIDGLERIYQAKKKAQELLGLKRGLTDRLADQLWSDFVAEANKASQEISTHYANDLNTSGALGVFFSLIREWNRVAAHPKAMSSAHAVLGAQAFLQVLEIHIVPVLGFGHSLPESAFQQLQLVRGRMGGVTLTSEAIEQKLQERRDARAKKDFAGADRIRDELLAAGVDIHDNPTGSTWTYRRK